jgi:hypothetical protein
LGSLNFSNEKPQEILKKLKEESLNNKERIQAYNTSIRVSTSYGSLIKGGLDTFGCNYSIEIKFFENWYELYMDDKVMVKNNNLQMKRLYHKPITKAESKALSQKFGDVIYEHILQGIKQISEKKNNGDTKGSKGTKE